MINPIQHQQPATALLREPMDEAALKNADRKQLQEKANNFEALIIKQMLDIAMQHEDALFGGEDTAGSHIYRSMYHESISDQVSGGFGYSELLFNHLQEKL